MTFRSEILTMLWFSPTRPAVTDYTGRRGRGGGQYLGKRNSHPYLAIALSYAEWISHPLSTVGLPGTEHTETAAS